MIFSRKRKNPADPAVQQRDSGWAMPVFLMGILAICIVGAVVTVADMVRAAKEGKEEMILSVAGYGTYTETDPWEALEYSAGTADPEALSDSLRSSGFTVKGEDGEYSVSGPSGWMDNARVLIGASGGEVLKEEEARKDGKRSDASAFVAAYADAALRAERTAGAMGLRVTDEVSAETVSLSWDGKDTTAAEIRLTVRAGETDGKKHSQNNAR